MIPSGILKCFLTSDKHSSIKVFIKKGLEIDLHIEEDLLVDYKLYIFDKFVENYKKLDKQN